MSTLDISFPAGLGGPKPASSDALWGSLARENLERGHAVSSMLKTLNCRQVRFPLLLLAACTASQAAAATRRTCCIAAGSLSATTSERGLEYLKSFAQAVLHKCQVERTFSFTISHSRRAAHPTLCRGLLCDQCCLRGTSPRYTTQACLPDGESSQIVRLVTEQEPPTLILGFGKALQDV